jgi:hypothetical protein
VQNKSVDLGNLKIY